MGELSILPPVPGIPFPPQFDSAYLYIGGELVREWHRGGGGGDIPIQHIALVEMFDASHFSPGTSVQVKITGWDSHGRYYEGTGASPNQNFARCFNLPEFGASEGGNGAPVAASFLSAMNYGALTYLDNWNDELFGALIFDTIIYVNSHGDPYNHEACDETNVWASEACPTAARTKRPSKPILMLMTASKKTEPGDQQEHACVEVVPYQPATVTRESGQGNPRSGCGRLSSSPSVSDSQG
jgi:hypothetical protein